MVSIPSVSVALCTHNGAAYVGEQVRSILAQTVRPQQIVLSDDASTDGTVEVVQQVVAEFRAAASAVAAAGTSPTTAALELTILRNDPPLGVARNFAQAMRHASGDLIALSDQDDRWMPDRLERALERLADEPDLLLVHSDARLVDGQLNPLGHTLLEALEVTEFERASIHDGEAFRVLLRRNLVTGATVVLRRDLVDLVGPIPESWIHDEWFAIIASAVGRIDLLESPLIDYRQHDTNQIGAEKPTLRQKISKLREPRRERNDHLVARAADLVEKLDALAAVGVAIPVERRDAARGKQRHDQRRRTLPAVRVARIPGVLAALARGDYRRFSRGAQDALRDLTQPDG